MPSSSGIQVVHESPQRVLSNASGPGNGLWAHVQKSNDPAQLPPIKKTNKEATIIVQADLRAERNVNQILETKYLEAVNEAESNAQKAHKALYDLDKCRQELNDTKLKFERLQAQINQSGRQMQDFNSALEQSEQLFQQA